MIFITTKIIAISNDKVSLNISNKEGIKWTRK